MLGWSVVVFLVCLALMILAEVLNVVVDYKKEKAKQQFKASRNSNISDDVAILLAKYEKHHTLLNAILILRFVSSAVFLLSAIWLLVAFTLNYIY